ncbi:hypothetical protein [Kordiimonas sp. SCSIO 12610]|uniref:gliding motility protein GldB-related protein n=1 Tax=Kordiimonas sp. SCSIO 12610 TaxID=2829597 RepID=UPI00210C0EEC|nr:hypothetical protein [Kordiimonas sp. SCSIO 12610]UTW56073.1 hypothetical protein KFF44_04040 [Kordiimonas sp. SCSIO 12610]
MSVDKKRIVSTVISTMALLATAGTVLNATGQDTAETEVSASKTTTKTSSLWLADYAAMRQLNELGQYAARNEKWTEAAAYYERASEHGPNIPSPTGLWLDYAAMDAHARAGNTQDSLRLLALTAKRGFRFPEFIAGNPLFAPVKEDPAFKTALALIVKNADEYRQARSSPDDANLIFDDVPRFWAAYDAADKFRSLDGKAAKFRELYLAPGTAGAIDYHWIKTKSMEQLAQKIKESKGFYDGIRKQTLKAASFEPQIRAGFRKLKSIYKDAHFPDVTFVIGRLNSGGTAGPTGMLIGLDVWSWQEGVPLDGISPGFQNILTANDLSRLPYIVVHEQIHAMQGYTGKATLLRGVLQEGSADFLAQLALPDAELPSYFVWGAAHEEQVWNRFKEDMLGTDYSNWIANNNDAIGDDWHADLGYFIGAQICKAYYDQAADKQQAIKDLLYVNDAEAIFEKSGYASKFKN